MQFMAYKPEDMDKGIAFMPKSKFPSRVMMLEIISSDCSPSPVTKRLLNSRLID